jgi:hypothetical protein
MMHSASPASPCTPPTASAPGTPSNSNSTTSNSSNNNSAFYPALSTPVDWAALLAEVRETLADAVQRDPGAGQHLLRTLPPSVTRTGDVPALLASIQGNRDLRRWYVHPRVPRLPVGPAATCDWHGHLARIQGYLGKLGYNHLGHPFHAFSKRKSLRHLMYVARDMVHHALPIKCLEATLLGVHLTMNLPMDRVPLSFKSEAGGEVYKHIVLVIRLGGKWGALGLSRRADLMDKPCTFGSLDELVEEYTRAYTANYHRLLKVKVGLPVLHDGSRNEPIPWKVCVRGAGCSLLPSVLL